MQFTNPKFQAFDGNGAPLSGGLVHTYINGTTTAKTTYKNRACTSANDNPIELDSRGECVIYGKGGFKFVLKNSAGVTIWTFDDLLMSSESLWDADKDTGWQVEEAADEDKLRGDTGGSQRVVIDTYGIQEDVSNTLYKVFNPLQLRGFCIRPNFAWVDADEITMSAGAYEVNGRLVFWNAKITLDIGSPAAAADWWYVYLDYSAITNPYEEITDTTSPTEVIWSATEPAWSESKRGWYNSDDRCIFAVKVDSTPDILEFFHDGDEFMFASAVVERGSADLDTTWTDVDCSDSMPKFAIRGIGEFELEYVDTDGITAYWRTNGQTDNTGHAVGQVAAGATITLNVVTMLTDASQVIEAKLSAAGADKLGVYVSGWFFPNGM